MQQKPEEKQTNWFGSWGGFWHDWHGTCWKAKETDGNIWNVMEHDVTWVSDMARV